MGLFDIFDSTLSSENIAKAHQAGYSEFEWRHFTKQLRQSFVTDPTFGQVVIVAPQQATGSPFVAGAQAFVAGVTEDLKGIGLGLKQWVPVIVVGILGAVALVYRSEIKSAAGKSKRK